LIIVRTPSCRRSYQRIDFVLELASWQRSSRAPSGATAAAVNVLTTISRERVGGCGSSTVLRIGALEVRPARASRSRVTTFLAKRHPQRTSGEVRAMKVSSGVAPGRRIGAGQVPE
jgi:hypothetical protein